MPDEPIESEDPGRLEEAVDLVRRRLLFAGGRYVAPAVLVSLVVERGAWAQGSCQPASCPPVVNRCGPTRGTPCAPNRGG